MRYSIPAVTVATILLSTIVLSQDQPSSDKQALQQRIADLKQSIASNQANLKKYQWLQTTQVSIKGETKKEEQQQFQPGAVRTARIP